MGVVTLGNKHPLEVGWEEFAMAVRGWIVSVPYFLEITRSFSADV